jgi:hypothetical protein
MPKGIFAPFDEPNCMGVPASPMLITPIRQKKYDMYKTAINSLWTQSKHLLGTANKVVVIGYRYRKRDMSALSSEVSLRLPSGIS